MRDKNRWSKDNMVSQAFADDNMAKSAHILLIRGMVNSLLPASSLSASFCPCVLFLSCLLAPVHCPPQQKSREIL